MKGRGRGRAPKDRSRPSRAPGSASVPGLRHSRIGARSWRVPPRAAGRGHDPTDGGPRRSSGLRRRKGLRAASAPGGNRIRSAQRIAWRKPLSGRSGHPTLRPARQRFGIQTASAIGRLSRAPSGRIAVTVVPPHRTRAGPCRPRGRSPCEAPSPKFGPSDVLTEAAPARPRSIPTFRSRVCGGTGLPSPLTAWTQIVPRRGCLDTVARTSATDEDGQGRRLGDPDPARRSGGRTVVCRRSGHDGRSGRPARAVDRNMDQSRRDTARVSGSVRHPHPCLHMAGGGRAAPGARTASEWRATRNTTSP